MQEEQTYNKDSEIKVFKRLKYSKNSTTQEFKFELI